ncbi:MAG TPA: glycosyl hydrolase family 8, partial [Bacteroidales bacterium]|nr:glycosyl hydrolase family 8 [Bacteroidales bacterium]
MKQGNVQKHLNRQRGFITRIALLVAMISLFVTAGFAQRNYPFPQNYKYPYGNIYTGTDVQTKIQSLYNAWKTTYYVEGTMTGGSQSGKPAARIKFQQPGQDGSTTVSEGIAYGMLIFVYMDNATNSTQDEFNRLWTYYQGNANGNGFMNWKVSGFTGQLAPGTGNANGATDADIDVANALLMAHKQWGSAGAVNYLTAARTLINAIYTFEVDGNKLLKPGDAFNDYANPCYYITNSTTLFGKVEVDQGWNGTDRWQAVNTACYALMKASRNATTGLVPDWCHNGVNGAYAAPISGIIGDKFESYFLYDAIRIPWRMAHAYAWYGHADAKDVASKITTWVQGAHSDPATIWDGYLLNGNVFNNPTGNPNFATLGKNHNPCFSGGLSVGATVDNAFSSYMSKCWTEGSKTDNYGAYYTHTTQLLYMLFLTGNMPNFWDMKPVPVAAETNANGNAIYVDFSKSLATTTSTTGWTVQTFADETDVTPTSVTVSAISVLDKRVTVTLAADIAEPFIKISYSGTSIKSSADNLVADAFSNLLVTNKITNMEPYPVVRMTDVLGTMVKIQWSKEISPASISGGFTVKINGTTAPVGTPTLDPEDATILNIPLSSTLVTSAADVVTVTFAGGSITGTTSAKTAKAFTDAPVQNFYLNVTCYTITDFDANLNASFASWIAGVWSSAGTDPAGGTDKVGYFNGDNTTAYISTKATISAANQPAFGTALYTSGSRLKAKLYAKSGTFATGEQIKIVFAHAALADAGSYYDPNQIQFLITPPSTNAWFEIDLPINGVVDNGYDFIQMTGSNVDKTGNKTNAEFYVDDMQICPAPPTVSVVTGRTSYDGGTIELRFSTAMKVPTSASEISVTVDGLAASVSSITAKQGDATVLVLIMATPISDPNAVITVSGGSSAGLKAVDGRMAEYFYMTPVVNLVGISITTGWRDNFNSSTDYVTANIGVGTAWDTPAPTETATGDGYYKVVGDGSAAWSSIDITTWVDQPDANKEVMDLSGREKVEIRYRIPSATSTTLYLRVDLKDKANGTASDAMAFVPLTISSTWQTKTIDVSAYFVKKYGVTEPVVVDRSNIYQVMFYFIEKEGTAANNYVPTNFKGTIEFDYISVGSALILTVPTTTINEGQTLAATSSAAGKIYLVPNNTAPVLTALQDSVFAGKGKVIDVTAN